MPVMLRQDSQLTIAEHNSTENEYSHVQHRKEHGYEQRLSRRQRSNLAGLPHANSLVPKLLVRLRRQLA